MKKPIMIKIVKILFVNELKYVKKKCTKLLIFFEKYECLP